MTDERIEELSRWMSEEHLQDCVCQSIVCKSRRRRLSFLETNPTARNTNYYLQLSTELGDITVAYVQHHDTPCFAVGLFVLVINW
jgi:hypothetical protein